MGALVGTGVAARPAYPPPSGSGSGPSQASVLMAMSASSGPSAGVSIGTAGRSVEDPAPEVSMGTRGETTAGEGGTLGEPVGAAVGASSSSGCSSTGRDHVISSLGTLRTSTIEDAGIADAARMPSVSVLKRETPWSRISEVAKTISMGW